MEDFYDNFVDQIDSLGNKGSEDDDGGDKQNKLEELLDTFNDEGISNYLVAFMRLLTSKQMKKEADLYINYIDDQADVNEFCALEVEPMFKESDFVHIHALQGNECDRQNRIP